MRFDIGTLDSGERSLPFGLLVLCADPATFIAFQKEIKRFSYLVTLKCFRNWTKSLKYVRIAELMLRIKFLNCLDVLNFIICMFPGTVDDI